ncbi:hypothetical protein [Clostridium muellerianum]|nr:hypothetical protein [Clostridium muellerianum]
MLTFTEYKSEGDFSELVCKIRYDEDRTRLTYIKALSGTVF